MRTETLRDVIATDIPQTYAGGDTAPLEIDDDLTKRDAWMFGPLAAAAITLPVIATVLLAFSAWHMIEGGPSFSSSRPTTFASRWPDKDMPLVIVR